MITRIKEKYLQLFQISIPVEELDNDADLFGPESPFGLDSMDVLMFINELKEEFGLEYNQINTDAFKTINNIVEFIESQKGIESKNSIK
ncbi:acyl carrier protein [Oceanobacillus sp. FSL H7-0719]|uniref:acyl carrier protein n=1 Tax=Oceanobacillus sp. FSL H7-0719 TaxID=2954507 RepID=UPI003253BAB9